MQTDRKALTVKDLYRIMKVSLRMLGVIFLMIVTAAAMGTFLQLQNLDQVLLTFLHSFTTSPAVFLMITVAVLLFLGTFIEITAIILILTPFLVPLAASFGVNPVHFGILMLISLCVGDCTPPVGSNLFVVCSITDLPILKVSKALLPFIATTVVVLLLLAFFPPITLLFL